MSAASDYYSNGINLNGGQFGAPRENGRKHRGQDISHSVTPGAVAVPALHAGVVVSKTVPSSDHGFGYSTVVRSVLDGMLFDFRYAHGAWASQQPVGAQIAQGGIILWEGNSGATVGSCVHLEQQRVGGGFLDPLPEIRRVAAGRLTSAAPVPVPGRPVIRKGSKGPAVGDLQRRLNRDYPLYSHLDVDEDFGNATDRTLIEFQTRAGLEPDGVAGPKTWAALGF